LSPLPKDGYVEGDQPVDRYYFKVVVFWDDDKRTDMGNSTVESANRLRYIRDEDFVEGLITRIRGIEEDAHPRRYNSGDAQGTDLCAHSCQGSDLICQYS
jgi:hypothetical protein